MDKELLLYIEREEVIRLLLDVTDINIIREIRSILDKETAKVITAEEVERRSHGER